MKEDLHRVYINVFGTGKLGKSGWDNLPVEVIIIPLQTDVSVRVIVSEERHAVNGRCIEKLIIVSVGLRYDTLLGCCIMKLHSLYH
mmetsp:Transcript_8901/g.11491  ORF Transcript_8901/g.11491 Transcript_8901/m.11491 type:complete len:86 (-) Transcript_8901:23-280(-)